MKKVIYALFVLVFISGMFVKQAQADIGVTVTNNTNTTPNLAATYTSLALALADLNLVTAMSGPVVLTLAAGSSETAPPTGLSIGSATLNPALSSTNTVTIIAGGAGVTLNAGVGTATPTSAIPDGILKIVGADYITIEGITFTDGNTTNPATMEYGVALFKRSLSDGASNNTIKKCTFNMQRENWASGTAPMVEGSVAILVINSTPTAATTALVPTTAAGSNSYNKLYADTINGGNYGIVLSGYAAATPFTAGDFGNEVGAATLGNVILNYGGGAASTNPSAGIRANFQWGITIGYNTVNNNNGLGVNHPNTLRGIYAQAGTSANVTIQYNNVSVKGGGTTTALNAIENVIGATAASNTVNIFRNTVENCTYSTATTGIFYGIYNTATAATVNVNGNTVRNNKQSGTGTFTGIDAGAGTNVNVYENNVYGNVKTSPGTSACIMYGMRSSTGIISMHDNAIYSDTIAMTGGTLSGTLYGYYNVGSPTVETYYSNAIYNLVVTGPTTGTAGVIYGLNSNPISTTVKNWSLNFIHDLTISTTGGGSVYGIYTTTGATVNIFRNKVCSLSSSGAGGATNGIHSVSGTTVNVYNNLVGHLFKPEFTGTTSAVNGIYLAGGTTSNVQYNTVYINATSSGANFGTAAVYASSTPTVTLRNNIFTNTSTASGTGLTAAYRRSSTTLTTYGSASNTNYFFAGTPSSTNVIFYDGTSYDRDLGEFQTRVTPRDAASVTNSGGPVFVSTACGEATFLHMDPAASVFESGGLAIATYDNDYDNDIRQGSAGYPAQSNGGGTAPDIGADEFDGAPNYTCSAPAPGNTISSATSLCFGQSITLSLENATAGTGVSYVWQSSTDGTTYTTIPGANTQTYSTTPLVSTYYHCIVTCAAGPVSGTSNPVQVTFSGSITNTRPGSRCGTGTVQLEATSSTGSVKWFNAATGGSPIGSVSPFTTPVIATTTSFYAAAFTGGTTGAVGPVNNSFGAGGTVGLDYYLIFDVLAASMMLEGVYVYPAAAGNVNLYLKNSTGTVLNTISYPVSSGSIGLKTYIPLNFLIPSGTAYRLGWNTGGVSLYRNTAGAVYPYTLAGVASITGHSFTGYPEYYYYCYDWQVSTDCTSPRTEVVATVTPPPALTVTANQTVCNNTATMIAVTSTIADFNTYVWNPATNLFTDPACTLAYDGIASAETLYVKSAAAASTTYTCTGANTTSGCVNTAQTTVATTPANPSISYTPESICISGTVVFTLVPATGWGNATFQWQDSPDNVTFTSIPGATTQNYTTTTLTDTTSYKLLIRNSAGDLCSEHTATILISNPQLTGTTAATRCGIGTVNLAATGTGGTLKWYAASSGGSALGAGSPFTTPVISATTSYFVGCEAYVPGSVAVGAGASTTATYSNPFYSLYSNIHTQHLITAAELTAAGVGQGNLLSVALYVTSAGTLPMIDFTLKIATTTATDVTSFLSPSFSTVYSSASYMPVVGSNVLTFSSPFYWDGVSNLVLEFCHGNRESTATMSRTVRSDATSYVATIKTHATVATPGATICGDITTNKLTYSVRPQFTFRGQAACSTPRTEVIATVTPPPALTITAGQTICPNEVKELSVTSTVGNFDTYTWSPVTGLFTDADCLVPYTALTPANPVYVKSATGGSTIYTCTGTNNTSGCVNTAQTTIIVTPIPTINATPEGICISGTSTLVLVPATGYGTATFQWQESTDNVSFTDIAGATNVTYTTETISSIHYYKMVIKNASGAICSETVKTIDINNPSVTGTTPGTRCGTGTVELGATGSAGTTLKWYANATGGASLGSGSPFTTPAISATTDFYVEATSGGNGIVSVGPASPTAQGGTIATQTVAWNVNFTTLAATTIKSVDIFPIASGQAGVIQVRVGSTTSGTLLATVNYTTAVSGGATAQTIPINFDLPTPGSYNLYTSTLPTSGISRNTTGAVYPYTSSVANITGNGFDQTYFMGMYNWIFGSGCTSSRTAVTATVTPAPSIEVTASPTSICPGSQSTLTASSLNTNYTYTWTPGNLSGAVQSVSPTVATTYTATANDAGTGCSTAGTTTVTLLAAPTPLSVSPAAPVIAPGAIQQLDAVGGSLTFNAVTGTGTTTNTTTGYPAPYSNYYGGTKHQMLIRASELTTMGVIPGVPISSLSFTVTALGTTFTGSLDSFQIDMGHTNQSVLTSTAFLGSLTSVLPPTVVPVTIGVNTHTLTTPFVWDGLNNIVIQTSYSNDNNGTSTDFVQMTNTNAGFVSANWYRLDGISAAAVLAAVTPSGSGTSRPNITLYGSLPVTLAWTPPTNLFTDATALTAYAGENLATVYSKPASTTTYTVTSSSGMNSCTRSANVTVTVFSDPLAVTGTATNLNCYGGGSGAITTTVTGGVGPYTYVWSNSATTSSLSGIGAGTYTVTVTDATTTTVTGSWTVTQPAEMTISGVVSNAACPTSNDGSINITVTGGTAGYTYMWSNGATSEDLSGLAPGSYTVTVSDAHNCPMVGSWVVLITDPVCANITVTGAVTSTVCYDAYNTITVAGGVSTFTVSSPGNATFIAGVNILFKPGTLVSSGGYMRGYISASFCSPSDAPMVATAAAYDEPQAGLSNASFTLYPNPTNGNFTLVQKGENSFGNVRVDIYNMNGNRVMNAQMIGEKSHEFASSSLPSGIYFVKIIADGSVETIKLIVTR